jgi:hypothetical protein
MPTYFWMRFESLRHHSRGVLALELVMHHNTRRLARISAMDFELWLELSGGPRFLTALRPDIRGEVTEPNAQLLMEFRDTQQSRFRLLWHYTSEELQEIERIRNGGKPTFYVYANLFVQAIWQQPNQPPQVEHVIETPGREGGWPLVVAVAESEWIALLSQIGFKHPVMDRLPWPALPPAFARSEANLGDAWIYFRKGDPPGALNSCYKAFECLGFDLFGREVERKEVFDLLMAGASPEKQKVILGLLRSLQNVFHLGRHDKTAPVPLTQADAQMAVTCATVLLAYLSQHNRP